LSAAVEKVWIEEIIPPLKYYFGDYQENEPGSLNAFNQIWDYPLGQTLLFLRLKALMGFNFRPEKIDKITQGDWSGFEKDTETDRPFDRTDLIELGETIKHTNIIAHAQGYIYKSLATMMSNSQNAIKFFKMATEKFEEALNSNPTNKLTLRNCADVLLRVYLKRPSGPSLSITSSEVEYINSLYLKAIRSDPRDTHSLYQYAAFLQLCGEHDKSQDYFIKSIAADPDHYTAVEHYGCLLNSLHLGEEEKKLKAWASSTDNQGIPATPSLPKHQNVPPPGATQIQHSRVITPPPKKPPKAVNLTAGLKKPGLKKVGPKVPPRGTKVPPKLNPKFTPRVFSDE